MAELEILKLAASLGGGALMVAIVMVWKRADDQRYARALEEINGQLTAIIQANTMAMTRLEQAIARLTDVSALEERLLARMAEGAPTVDARPARRASSR